MVKGDCNSLANLVANHALVCQTLQLEVLLMRTLLCRSSLSISALYCNCNIELPNCVYMACRTFAWQIKGVLATAGRLPDDGHGNHCTLFDDHKCPVTALAISACNSMMASADASGRIVVRFSLQQP